MTGKKRDFLKFTDLSYDEHLGVDALVDGVRWYERLIERIPG